MDIGALNASEYKRYHESLMQNNHGSSATHVFFCVFFTVQCSVYSSLRITSCTKNRNLFEYITIVLPLILAHTVLADNIYVLNVTIFIMLAIELPKHLKNVNILNKHTFSHNKVQSISLLRGLTYLITVNCILAVDFNDFPRYLAKTERFGYSLMDTGVGLFVLMSGLVHKDLKSHNLLDIIKGNMKFIIVLTVLGVARYVSVKQLDYHEHVTEYGVHWNFFFTLAVCKLLSTLILYFTDKPLMLSILLLFIHEFVLYFGLQDWVFSSSARDNFISANREGISSSLGYVSMYLFAAHLKQLLLKSNPPFSFNLFNKNILISFNQTILYLMSITLFCLVYFINNVRPASRTLANSAYCLYLEFMLVTIISLLYYLETVFQDDKNKFEIPRIINNINCNGLSYFLVANLLTGAVNLSVRTLTVSSVTTFIILNVYMMVTLTLTSYLKRKGIRI